MAKKAETKIVITAPDFKVAEFHIVGTAPLVQHKFSAKAQQMIREKQEAGDQAKGKKAREAKDFDSLYEQATYRSKNGEYGIPASAFRCAIISACKVVGFVMTRAKLGIFIIADVEDETSGTQLVKLTGKPEKTEMMARNDNGSVDIRVRPMFRKWELDLKVQYDNSMFSAEDITNLLMRAGMQVGVGEGRPDSKKSTGMGWGTFRIDIPKGNKN